MNTFYKTLILAFICVGLGSCATGKNAFDKGEYQTALRRAVKRLQANPNNKKAKQVLIDGYRYASDYHLNNIRNFSGSSDLFKWENIYGEYQALNKYYNDINQCPVCLTAVTPKNYFDQQEEAAYEAANIRMNMGLEALSYNSVETGRQAYGHFEVAYRYNNRLADIDSLISVARNMGTIKVLIEPIPLHSRNLQLTNEYFENRMLEYFRGYESNHFVDFFNYEEMEAYQKQPDQVITMQFDDFALGQTFIKSDTREIKRDSVVVGHYTDDEGIRHDVYGTVKAEYTVNSKTLASNGLLNFVIRDAYNNQVLINRKIESQDIWTYRWASFNGDERALNNKEIRLAEKREIAPPSPQQLFASFIDRIYDQVVGNVRSLYRNSRI